MTMMFNKQPRWFSNRKCLANVCVTGRDASLKNKIYFIALAFFKQTFGTVVHDAYFIPKKPLRSTLY